MCECRAFTACSVNATARSRIFIARMQLLSSKPSQLSLRRLQWCVMHASRTFVPSPTLVPGGGGGRSGAASADAEQPILDGVFLVLRHSYRTPPPGAACSTKSSSSSPPRTLWPPPAVVRWLSPDASRARETGLWLVAPARTV